VTACAVAARAVRAFGPKAAAPAAAIFLALPAVYRASHNACTESPQVLYTVLVLVSLAAYRDRRSVGAAVLAGVLTGFSVGVTFAAGMLLFVPAASFLVVDGLSKRPRRTGLWAALGYVCATALAVSPWLVRNLAWTGNPVHPFLTGLFGPGPYWTAAMASRFAADYSPPPDLLASLGRALVPGSALDAVPVVLVLGLGALALAKARDRRPSAVYLAGYAVIVFVAWFLTTPHLTRHLAPLWPPLAGLAAGGVLAAEALRWRRVAMGAGLAVVFTGMIYILGSERATAREELLRDLDPSATSAAAQPDYSAYVVNYLNVGYDLPEADRRKAPADAPVAVGLVGDDRTLFHVRPVVWNTVWDRPWLAPALAAWEKTRSAHDVRAALGRLGIGTVYVNWLAIEDVRRQDRPGWPETINAALFEAWVKAGVLEPIGTFGRSRGAGLPAPHVLYRVAYPPSAGR